MRKIFIISVTIIFIFNSCYKEDDFAPSQLSNIMNLIIENDNQLADGVSKIKIITEFPANFSTEDDNKVKFIITGSSVIEIEADIRLVEINGINKKIAETYVVIKNVETLSVKAIISIKQSEISKESDITFRRAFCETIDLTSSSLTIKPDSSFSEITLTTKLLRNVGVVSTETEASIKVVDLSGLQRGIFVNYNSKTDSLGVITNQFTMGNDSYIGQLFAISESIDEANNIKKDTLIFYSQN